MKNNEKTLICDFAKHVNNHQKHMKKHLKQLKRRSLF